MKEVTGSSRAPAAHSCPGSHAVAGGGAGSNADPPSHPPPGSSAGSADDLHKEEAIILL